MTLMRSISRLLVGGLLVAAPAASALAAPEVEVLSPEEGDVMLEEMGPGPQIVVIPVVSPESAQQAQKQAQIDELKTQAAQADARAADYQDKADNLAALGGVAWKTNMVQNAQYKSVEYSAEAAALRAQADAIR